MNPDGSPAWWVWAIVIIVALAAGIYVGRQKGGRGDAEQARDQEDPEGG